jgi:restriction system protein
VNSWILPLRVDPAGNSGLLRFREEVGAWWNGEPEESRESKYRKGDIVYLENDDGNLWGWGNVVSINHDVRMQAEDEEGVQAPLLWIKYSDTLVIQPKVILSDTIWAPVHAVDEARLLNEKDSQAILYAFKKQGMPRLITLDHINPGLISRLKKDPEILRTLHWRDFEHLLARILEEFGYSVDRMRGTKDGGVDLFALSSAQHPLGPHRYLLQAKRWRHSVGVAPIRELRFLHDQHKITKSCLATTSRFTSGAWQLAQQYSYQLDLRDFGGINDWINRVHTGSCE